MRPQPRVWVVSFGHTRFSHHENTDTSGVPHAMVFSACFVLSPANGRNLSPSGLSCTVRPLSDRMVSCGPHGRQALHPFDGTTRLEPTREAMSVRRISAPAASHSVVVSRRSGLLSASPAANAPFAGHALGPGSRPQDLMLRPDAAASTASRPAYRDDREPPLSVRRDG